MNPTRLSSDPFLNHAVAPEQRRGVARIGRRRLATTVQEASIDGFTVLLPPRAAAHVRLTVTWRLQHNGATYQVRPEWLFHTPTGEVLVGLRQIADLTKPTVVLTRWWCPWPRRRQSLESSSPLLLASLAAALLLFFTLPGVGDTLGTSQRMSQWLTWLSRESRQIMPW